MSFRLRVFSVVFAVLGLLLTLVGWWARTQLVEELSLAHRDRVEAEWARARSTMTALEQGLGERVRAVAKHLESDSNFRLALLGRNTEERRTLVDYAGRLWFLTGLGYLEILSADGIVLSSAHFRESHGTTRSNAHYLLSDDVVQARVPLPSGEPQVTWARAARVQIAGEAYLVWGGTDTGAPLATVSDTDVYRDEGSGPGSGSAPVVHPGVRPDRSHAESGQELSWSRIDFMTGETRQIRRPILVSNEGLVRARNSLDRTLLAALGASLLAALFLSWVVARWIERPVRELIDKTLQVRVGREGVLFDTGRSDEIGELAGFIGSMVRRLRDSAETLREAERRATLGDVARQVHHDVKNGVVPLRGVMRHLEEVAEHDPGDLPRVFRERAGTMESGLEYLEALSTHYAKLTKRVPLEPVDVRELLEELARTWEQAHPELLVDLSVEGRLPPVQSEALGLRRVLENLAKNAVDAMTGGDVSGMAGGVHVAERSVNEDGARKPRLALSAVQIEKRDRIWVEIAIRDEGPGMGRDALDRVFEPFYTTKETGTGLGLSIVRRLVTDYGGRVDVESTIGRGTTFRVLLPAWGA